MSSHTHTHLLDVAGYEHDVHTAGAQLVDYQEGIDHVTVTQETPRNSVQSVPHTHTHTHTYVTGMQV
jgi:hypothetical protein